MSIPIEPTSVHLSPLLKREMDDTAKISPNPPLPKGGTESLPEPKGETRPISASEHTARVRRTVIVLVALVVMGYVGFIVMMGWR